MDEICAAENRVGFMHHHRDAMEYRKGAATIAGTNKCIAILLCNWSAALRAGDQ